MTVTFSPILLLLIHLTICIPHPFFPPLDFDRITFDPPLNLFTSQSSVHLSFVHQFFKPSWSFLFFLDPWILSPKWPLQTNVADSLYNNNSFCLLSRGFLRLLVGRLVIDRSTKSNQSAQKFPILQPHFLLFNLLPWQQHQIPHHTRTNSRKLQIWLESKSEKPRKWPK